MIVIMILIIKMKGGREGAGGERGNSEHTDSGKGGMGKGVKGKLGFTILS